MSEIPVDESPSPTVKDSSLRARIDRLLATLDNPQNVRVLLALVLLLAAWFRFHGLNWDEGHHLHPDERFLSSLTNDLTWPDSFANYFDPTTSTLSPYSLPNMGLFVYGTLPVYAVKWMAVLLDGNTYDEITLLGRAMSVLFDLGAIFILFLIGRRLYGQRIGLLAAALMALCVLSIQVSHFYTVDTFANLFVLATFFYVIRASQEGRWLDYALAGLMFGLGLASKLNVVTLVVPILLGAALDLYRRRREGDVRLALEQSLVRLVTLFFIAALTFRVLQPVAFSGPGFLDMSLNPQWLDDIREQAKLLSGTADLPWVQQWTGRSILFPLYNMVVWGMGLPLGLAGLAGFALAAFELWRYRKLEHLFPLLYVGVTFIYHSLTFIKFMRYFLPIYPFLVLMAAYLIVWLWRHAAAPAQSAGASPAEPPEEPVEPVDRRTRFRRGLGRLRPGPGLVLGVMGVVVLGTLLYALAFTGIYSRQHSRLAASRWMYQNIPAGSTLANEHWDDWLPIGGVDGMTSYGDNGNFKSVEMKNYEDDTPEKLDQMVANLTEADYIVLSSNRLYDSIPRLPMRYPMTSRYYELLFSGKLGFERVAEFTSYPTLFGIRIPDQSSEESFSVYDHPRVQIFEKTAAFDPEKVRQELGQGIDWSSVTHVTPRQASSFRSGLLMLTSQQEALYQRVATWSSAEVSENSWGSHFPLLAWVLALTVLGLLALPLTLVTFSRLADRGYIFGKAVGLLIVAWGAWMLASVRIAPFTWWAILAVMAALAAGSLFLLWQRWGELRSFVQAQWRLLILEEALFWLFFGILVFIRWNNPDLWHPGLGGEKPMDLAYLTAITRTPYFPSYDPWFAGGYINYYYFGFVLVAVLSHLTGIVPYITYNLAVPTFFAMLAMGGFTVAFNLAEWWPPHGRQRGGAQGGARWLGVPRGAVLAGVCGALFVAIIGNLAQIQLIWNGVRALSVVQAPEHASPLLYFMQFGDGLGQWLVDRSLHLRTEWWYWNATRVIDAAPGEAGPINELPFFTFLFADLHAHMMALPYTLLALGLALNIVRDPVGGAGEQGRPLGQAQAVWWRDPAEVLTLALLALTVGALWPMNTWDFPTYTALVAAALACREYARRGRVDLPGLWAVTWRLGLIVVGGRLLFLPFHDHYATSYFGAELWKGSRTGLKDYLIIHGLFLFVLTSYLIAELLKGHGHNALVRSLRLPLRHWRRLDRIQELSERLSHPTQMQRLAVRISRIAFVLVLAVLLIDPVVGLGLALATLAALLLFSSRPDPRRQFLLCMFGLGLVLTALVEVVVLKGDISRMNTVFKFYLQVWVLWGVSSAGVLPELAAHLSRRREAPAQAAEVAPTGRPPILEPEEGSAWTPQVAAQFENRHPTRSRSWARGWWWAFGLLFGACLLYPVTAAKVRIGDRFENSVSKTLDGSAYMRTSVYMDDSRPVTLEWDRQAFEWLRANVKGIPTILEANTRPKLYSWGSRVSINTGLPTVIGWDWHQKQQRSVLPGPLIDQRIDDVATMYASTDLSQVKQLLDQYDVRYIYVGPLERLYYAGPGLDKFDQASDLWSLVYENEQVKIYKVQ